MSIKDILGISNAKLIIGNENYVFNGFSKDTRTIKPGDTYIGIKGENFDGNKFYLDAFLKGADTCILENADIDIETKKKLEGKNIILIDNALEFIMQAAEKKRSMINVPVIAITGSVGKTSTKNIVADILKTKYHVLSTIGNENSRLGMSLRILNYANEDCLVLEMGMNQAGEIKKLSQIAKPNYAIITNIGTSHIGNLGSRENILKAKLEILEGLNGPLIINNDNDLLNAWQSKKEYSNIITFGLKNNSDYKPENITYQKNGTIYTINNEKITIPAVGDAFIYNSLVALIIGNLFNIDYPTMKKTLANLSFEPHRMQFINTKNYTVIDDSYNASYDSIIYALDVLSHFNERKILVLGDIFELGEYEKEIHSNIGASISSNNIDILVTVGSLSKYINETAEKNGLNKNNSHHFNNNDEAITFLKNTIKENDIILIKASHAMNFTEIVDKLVK